MADGDKAKVETLITQCGGTVIQGSQKVEGSTVIVSDEKINE